MLTWLNNVIPEPTPVYRDFLAESYPNPFNPETIIRYGIRERSHVSLRIYDVAGAQVRTLVDQIQAARAGGYAVPWDGTNDRGDALASGVYFYRLVAGDFVRSKKMVLLK